jgi:hypothetical protein
MARGVGAWEFTGPRGAVEIGQPDHAAEYADLAESIHRPRPLVHRPDSLEELAKQHGLQVVPGDAFSFEHHVGTLARRNSRLKKDWKSSNAP